MSPLRLLYLGLAILGAVVPMSFFVPWMQANGGSLRVQNLPGVGCIFTVDLPRALSQQPAADAERSGAMEVAV